MYAESAALAFKTEKEYLPLVEDAIRRVDALLDTWTPENEFEKCCKADIVSVSALMKAAFSLNNAFASCGRFYTEAARLQFENPEKAKALVLEYAEEYLRAAELNRAYKTAIDKLIDLTAHTETDLFKLDSTYGYTVKMAETIKSFAIADSFKEIPLPTINFVLDFVLDDIVIER